MRKYYKTLIVSLSIIAILLATIVVPAASASAATGVGVSPGVLTFNNVYSGGSSQKQITVTNMDSTTKEISITKSGAVASWLSFTPSSPVSVNGNSSTIVTVKVEPPSSTSAGTYDGELQITVASTEEVSGSGAAIVPGVVVPVVVTTTTTATKSLSLTSVEIESVVYGEDLDVNLVLSNTGNVPATPKVKVEIMDAEQTTVIETHEETLSSIAPGVTANPTVSITYTDLEQQTNYWATVTVTLDGETIGQFSRTFDILKEGDAACILYLSAITSPSFISLGDEAEIVALVTNTGQANVDAKFIGTVTNSKGELVATLNSSILSIPTQTQGRLTVFFDPDKEGDYVIGGNVYYGPNGATTLADCSLFKTALLSVYKDDAPGNGWQLRDWFFLGAIIFLSLLVIILLMQRREGGGGGGYRITRNR